MVQGKFNLEKTKRTVLFDRLLDDYLKYAKDNHRSYKKDVTMSKVLLKTFIKILRQL